MSIPAGLRLTLAALLLLSGCGGVKAADLFIVTRAGATPAQRVTLVVDEQGNVSCNGRAAGTIDDAKLVEARTIQEELAKADASGVSLPARRGSVYSYVLRDENGTYRFADNSSGQLQVMRELELFVLQVSQETCHLTQ